MQYGREFAQRFGGNGRGQGFSVGRKGEGFGVWLPWSWDFARSWGTRWSGAAGQREMGSKGGAGALG
jgi:hypothetical protein